MRILWLIWSALFVFACSAQESQENSPEKRSESEKVALPLKVNAVVHSLSSSVGESSSSELTSSSSAAAVFPLTVKGASGSGVYAEGASVVLALESKSESLCFNGWSVSPSKYSKALNVFSADSASFTMPGDSVQISAGFKSCMDDQETVVIGNLRWMTKNLNSWTFSGSSCYGKKRDNCRKYGRLYDFETAKRICPKGWRLPSDAEWSELTKVLGDDGGTKLKSREGWQNDEEASGNGNDAMGFRALPSGIVYEGSYMYQGFHTYYWTSTERDSTTAYYRSLSYDASDIYRYYNFKTAGYSVRCVQNAK